MKKFYTILFVLLTCLLTAGAQTGAPAFPGAEGHGRYVSGGRNPADGSTKIIHVTNLKDSGTGSFRSAVSGSDYKTIVFDVGGVIPLNSDIVIGDNTTIAGQTAPEPGITLRYRTIRPGGNNIIRFIRIRRGEEKDVNDGADAIWQRQKNGIIIDHCSFSWSIDEVASFYDNNNFTMQWCTIGESLLNAGHGKGAHGYGGIWGGKLASFHHNMICHVQNRSPRFCGARYDWGGFTSNKLYAQYRWENAVQSEIVDFRNCVIYNCGNGCYGGPGGGYVNMVNNYYKTGPAGSTSQVTKISIANSTTAEDYPKYWGLTSRYYINGNTVNSNTNYDWTNISYDSGIYTIGGEKYCADPNHYYGSNVEYKKNTSGQDCVKIKLDEPVPAGEVTTHTASRAYSKVANFCGASLCRDEVDARYMTELRNGTATYKGSVTGKAGRIDKVSDVNGYTEANFGTGSRPEGYDTDRDGMPDEWETANGLDPNDKTDALVYTIDTKKQYYTNLEVYLNSVVQDIMIDENKDAKEAVSEYYPGVENPDEGDDDDNPEPVYYNATYNVKEGDSFKAGTTVNVDYDGETIATITYGVEKDNDFNAATANSNVAGFGAFTSGNGVNGTANGGTVYYIKPTYDGTITVAIVLNAGKSFFILEDGTPLDNYNGITVNEKKYGTFTFDVKAGATYAVFCTGSKLGFYGFNYSWTKPNTDSKLHGDVNEDGNVDISDIVAVINQIAGTATYRYADVNEDNNVDISDIVAMINLIAGQE